MFKSERRNGLCTRVGNFVAPWLKFASKFTHKLAYMKQHCCVICIYRDGYTNGKYWLAYMFFVGEGPRRYHPLIVGEMACFKWMGDEAFHCLFSYSLKTLACFIFWFGYFVFNFSFPFFFIKANKRDTLLSRRLKVFDLVQKYCCFC